MADQAPRLSVTSASRHFESQNGFYAQDAVMVAEKIRSALNQPFELPGYQSLNISSSAGIAIYPDHGTDVIELSKNADDAMYQAKALGRNMVRIFQPRK